MTSAGAARERWNPLAEVDRPNMVCDVLLACGIVAPLVYAAADVFGGMRYPGYSFSSQMVSELMATGAPSEAFVDPLFLAFNALVLAFSVGVMREAAGRSRALFTAGILLSVYAIAGFAGPTFFEMHPRGTGPVSDDLPHIVLTGIIVLLQLTAIGIGALAFGRRFRVYSFTTLVAVLAFGAMTGSAGRLMAAGEPTPGFGTLERICIYTSLLWIAVLAVTLLRARRSTMASSVHGTVAHGFEEVRAEFERNVIVRGEIGAAVAVLATSGAGEADDQ